MKWNRLAKSLGQARIEGDLPKGVKVFQTRGGIYIRLIIR